MLLREPAVGGAGDAEQLPYLFCIMPRLQATGQNHHIDRDAPLFAGQRILGLNDELPFLALVTRRVRDLGHLAAHKECPFVEHALVELIVGLVGRAHVDVKVVDRRAGPLVDEVGKLQSLHAADDRAVVVEILVA